MLADRASRRTGMPTIFYDRHFSEHFNAYLSCPLAPAVVVLDSTHGSADDLTARALDAVRRHLSTVSRDQSDAAVLREAS